MTRRLTLIGSLVLLLWALLPAAPAHAKPSISVSGGGTVSGQVTMNVSVTSGDPAGLAYVSMRLTSAVQEANDAMAENPGTFPTKRDPGGNAEWGNGDQPDWVGAFNWDSRADTPYNGVYSFEVTAKDNSDGSVEEKPPVTVRVNNPPAAADFFGWEQQGTVYKNATAKLSWRYGGDEPDFREFQIERVGPDGTKMASVSPNYPEKQGCTIDNSIYSCTDGPYPADGSYRYRIIALRASPTGSSTQCRLDGDGNQIPNNGFAPCVGTASTASRTAAVTKPQASPSPTTGGSGGSGGSGGGSSLGFRKAEVSRTIVGAQRRTGEDDAEFFQGTYTTKLPYSNQTLIVPEGQATVPGQNRVEAVGGSENSPRPLGIPLTDRTVLLPMAGGLLLFLGAAHFRRLLADR